METVQRPFPDADVHQIFRLWLAGVLRSRSIDLDVADVMHSCFALCLNVKIPDGLFAIIAHLLEYDMHLMIEMAFQIVYLAHRI